MSPPNQPVFPVSPVSPPEPAFGFPGGQRVFEAARRTFERCGYRLTTLAAVAEEARIPAAALWKRYPTTADLFVAVVAESRLRQAREARFAHLRAIRQSRVNQLRALISSYLLKYREDAGLLEAEAEFYALGGERARARLVEVNRQFCEGACEHFEKLLRC